MIKPMVMDLGGQTLMHSPHWTHLSWSMIAKESFMVMASYLQALTQRVQPMQPMSQVFLTIGPKRGFEQRLM